MKHSNLLNRRSSVNVVVEEYEEAECDDDDDDDEDEELFEDGDASFVIFLRFDVMLLSPLVSVFFVT